mmetsp:Transcript_3389/g.5704  ORF Transcript_3389/g.5704 Transcript_3389/m.5704 type:complete len:377 (-) Transcript_3389:856-1986(-)
MLLEGILDLLLAQLILVGLALCELGAVIDLAAVEASRVFRVLGEALAEQGFLGVGSLVGESEAPDVLVVRGDLDRVVEGGEQLGPHQLHQLLLLVALGLDVERLREGVEGVLARPVPLFVVGVEALHHEELLEAVGDALLALDEGAGGDLAVWAHFLEVEDERLILLADVPNARHPADRPDLVPDHLDLLKLVRAVSRQLLVEDALDLLWVLDGLRDGLVLPLLLVDLAAVREESVEHLGDAVAEEGHRPLQHVHVVGQLVGLHNLIAHVELLDLQALVFHALRDGDGRPVLVGAAVVGGGEDRYDQGVVLLALPHVQVEPLLLHLVRPHEREEALAPQQVLYRPHAEVEAAVARLVPNEVVVERVLVLEERVAPE